jgi:hypothetical protein
MFEVFRKRKRTEILFTAMLALVEFNVIVSSVSVWESNDFSADSDARQCESESNFAFHCFGNRLYQFLRINRFGNVHLES